jgi:hypothetical protein
MAIMTTRVGVLLVHGIGETKKFENIETVASNIAAALLSDPYLKVRVIINDSDDAEYRASQQTWLANEKEPLVIEVTKHDPNDQSKVIKVTELIFSEAWWADLGKSDSLSSQLSFWRWGLSLWSRKQYLGKKEQKFSEDEFGTLNQVHLPTTVSIDKTPNITLFGRYSFFVVSWVVFLIQPLLSFLSFILRKILAFDLRPDILVQYLGDIKNYQEQKRERDGAGYLTDIGQPPRISVRRRMIKGLVKMGLANYDRWYVLSHSLGTVVAFNGLMEPDAVLPNYLNEDLWKKCQNSGIGTKATTPLTEKQAGNMFPKRPAWLDLDDIIAREDLFKNLKGFMTYGSPLSKFGVVWPAIVPINKDNSVFSADFEWINVYDPTDPVAGKTQYFDLENYGGKKPIEIAYKAGSIHLLSHIKYLTYNPKRKNPLVKQVAYWLLEGDNFKQPSEKTFWGWPNESVTKLYTYIRYFIWFVAGLFISWTLGLFISWQLPDSIKNKFTQSTNLDISNLLIYFVGSAVIVLLIGVFARFWNYDNE